MDLGAPMSFFFPSVPLGVDFELPNWRSNPRKCWFYYGNPYMFKEIKVFVIQRWFWKRFGALLGSLWELLGVFWELLGASRSITKNSRFAFGITWASFARFLLPTMASGASICLFTPFRNLLGPILSSRTDPPTLENVDFTLEILTFLKNQRFRSKDGFESVLGLSRPPFGSSWGALGKLLGALSGF